MLAFKLVIYMCLGRELNVVLHWAITPSLHTAVGLRVKLGVCLTHAGPWVPPQVPPKKKGWEKKEELRERTLYSNDPFSVCTMVQIASWPLSTLLFLYSCVIFFPFNNVTWNCFLPSLSYFSWLMAKKKKPPFPTPSLLLILCFILCFACPSLKPLKYVIKRLFKNLSSRLFMKMLNKTGFDLKPYGIC